jgi:alpha-galactosidase
MKLRLTCGILILAFTTAGWQSADQTPANSHSEVLAARPPMGWNSWDGYGTTINEEQFKANAKWMADNLKASGWEYAVVDM